MTGRNRHLLWTQTMKRNPATLRPTDPAEWSSRQLHPAGRTQFLVGVHNLFYENPQPLFLSFFWVAFKMGKSQMAFWQNLQGFILKKIYSGRKGHQGFLSTNIWIQPLTKQVLKFLAVKHYNCIILLHLFPRHLLLTTAGEGNRDKCLIWSSTAVPRSLCII